MSDVPDAVLILAEEHEVGVIEKSLVTRLPRNQSPAIVPTDKS
ncbi:MAG: hypothetical protein ABI565_07780 [Vicinamibacteria bacterium]